MNKTEERKKSKYKGVTWNTTAGKWAARYKGKLLGYFKFEDEKKAALAYANHKLFVAQEELRAVKES